MSLKLPVPDPTENDFTLEKTGYETWYEHDSECGPSPDKMEDWKQEVLALIRLANYHKKRADTLREAVAPKMAEVDAIVHRIVSYPHDDNYIPAMRLASMLRFSILYARREKQRADDADARYDRFVSEWFEEDADYQRLVDVAESHIDPDCWLAKECQRIHEIFLKRFEEEQQND